jgi:hypothetical protein
MAARSTPTALRTFSFRTTAGFGALFGLDPNEHKMNSFPALQVKRSVAATD